MNETVSYRDSPSQRCPQCDQLLRDLSVFCPNCGAPLRYINGVVQSQLLANRYRVVKLIARGGMGAVYRAEDTRLGNAPVALKEMASSHTRGDTDAFKLAVNSFRREAVMLAKLHHPNLPRVIDQFDEDGKYYLVMELINGHTLAKELLLAGGRLPVDVALRYVAQLCDVLSYLHSQDPPIIYRDLKPSNVMITAGDTPQSRHVMLIDFGIARFYLQGKSNDTAVYVSTGYAPPEQYGQGQTDARTDIYALGVLLHHLLTGHDPISTPFALPPLQELRPDVPQHVALAVSRATAMDREQRFADVESFRQALFAPEVAPASQPPTVVLPTPVGAAQPAMPMWMWAAVAFVVVLVAVCAVTGWLFLGRTGSVAVSPTAEAVVQPVVATPRPENTLLPSPTTEAVVAPIAIATEAPSPTWTPIPTETPAPSATPRGASVLLTPSGARASRFAAAGVDAQLNTITYEPSNAVDGDRSTAWRVEGDGTEEWLEIQFSAPVTIQSIGVIPGYDKVDPFDGTDRFFQNHVVRTARFEFPDAPSVRVSFSQSREMQFVELPNEVRTASFRIVIESTYPAPPESQGGRDFTPISEVQVRGWP